MSKCSSCFPPSFLLRHQCLLGGKWPGRPGRTKDCTFGFSKELEWFEEVAYCNNYPTNIFGAYQYNIIAHGIRHSYKTGYIKAWWIKYGYIRLVQLLPISLLVPLSNTCILTLVFTPSNVYTRLLLNFIGTNLLKNCVGAGVFSVSGRVAQIIRQPGTSLGMTYIQATVLILLMSIWASYNFYIVGEACELTDSYSLAEAWGKTVSESSTFLVQSVVLIAPIVSCLASNIVLIDIVSALFRSFGVSASIYGNRNLVIGLLSTFVLFPLCSLGDLTALRNVSKFGLFGHALATITLLKRYLDGSYKLGGIFYQAPLAASQVVAAKKAVDTTSRMSAASTMMAGSKDWFLLASLLSYCFVAHYNAPKYYSELNDTSLPRFSKMATSSYLSAAVLYIISMALGLAIFGKDSQSFILNNLSSRDPLAFVARLAFGSSVLGSFPLIFIGMRNWFVEKWGERGGRGGYIKRVTCLLLLVISTLTTQFKDIGFVGSLSGAMFGVTMAFVFPTIIYLKTLSMEAKKKQLPIPVAKVILNCILLMMGVFLSGIGTYNSIASYR